MKIPKVYLALIGVLTLLPLTSSAQDLRPLTVEDALGTRSFYPFSPVVFSPDSKWLAYVAADNRGIQTADPEIYYKTGVSALAAGADIYVVNVKTGETRNLTAGKGSSWQPTWSPDGRHLAFISDRDGSGQARVWSWNTAKDDLEESSGANVRGSAVEWTPDSRNLLITVLPGNLSPEDYAKKLSSRAADQDTKQTKAPGSTVTLYESKAPSPSGHGTPSSDPWNLDSYLRDLALIDISTGKVKTIVHGQRIAKYLLSPNGSHIAYTIPKRFEKSGSQQILFDLVIVAVSTNQQRIVAPDVRLEYDGAEFSWAPDGRELSFRASGMEEGNSDCYVVGTEGGSPRNILSLPQKSSRRKSSPPVWDARGNHVYLIDGGALWQGSVDQDNAVELARIPDHRITHLLSRPDNSLWTPDGGKSTIVLTHDDTGMQDGLYKIELKSGQSEKLLEIGQCYTCTFRDEVVGLSSDGTQIAYLSEDAQSDSDLWISDATFRSPRRLTHLNPQFDKYKMGTAKLIDWFSADGERLHGALLLPAHYQEGRRYPLIVWVYGGGLLSSYFDHFGLAGSGPFNMQIFATRGYAVLLPDAPQHTGTPMLDLALTVLEGVNEVIEMGIADPDRVGLMGQSYGGYSTLSLIVQSKRFKAAVEADGYADLVAHYGEMDKSGAAFGISIEEGGQGLMAGPPWQFPNRYIENSPIFYLDRIGTPLFMAHGTADTTVAPFLGDEVFVGLRRLGKEVEYARYEGEGHSPMYWRYANQMDFCNRMIKWFEVHLGVRGP